MTKLKKKDVVQECGGHRGSHVKEGCSGQDEEGRARRIYERKRHSICHSYQIQEKAQCREMRCIVLVLIWEVHDDKRSGLFIGVLIKEETSVGEDSEDSDEQGKQYDSEDGV